MEERRLRSDPMSSCVSAGPSEARARALSGKQFTITAGEHEATIVEVGAGLRRYTHAGVDVTAPYGEDVLTPKGCGATLVPWPNRLRGGRYEFEGVAEQLPLSEPALSNASHGLARWARWDLREHAADRVTLAYDIPPQTGYPFEVLVEVTYALHADSGLTVTVSATNHGTGRAPFGAGFHPYLSTRGTALDDTTVLLPAGTRLLLDDAQLPVGSEAVEGTPYDLRHGKMLKTLRMDDGFTDLTLDLPDGRGAAEVRWDGGGSRLWFDAAFPFLQVYTLDDLGGSGPAIAIEPMSCAADAFNSGAGLIVLDTGGAWSGSWGILPAS